MAAVKPPIVFQREIPLTTDNRDSDHRFSYTAEALSQLATQVLEQAKQAGASASEVEVSEGYGQNVSVRLGEVETIEYTRDKGVGITVYLGQQKGHSSTSDFSPQAISDAVQAAVNIARFTASDPDSGLADAHRLARAPFQELALYHPWALPVETAIEMATAMEAAGQAVDPRITNSEGATVSTDANQFVYANSHGFNAGLMTSRHSLSASLLAQENDMMQRDYWYGIARDPADLPNVADIGRIAGERTVRRLGARRLSTRQAPVLFDPSLAAGLIGHFVGAVSGGSLYRKSSFLLDSLGQPVFSDKIIIDEDPFILKGLASGCFDSEGVATQQRRIIDRGVLQGYFLSSYSARKLGMETTGNAGGNHNLIVHDTGHSFADLLAEMKTGFLVTELLGHGVNPVTGDYSRGAAGFWVENGEIAYPVEEITIAGNLREMFQNITAVGNDVLVRGGKRVGSILVSNMTIAGD